MIAIADELRRTVPDARIAMLGTPEGLETRLLPQAGFDLHTIDKVPAPRSLGADVLKFPGKFIGAQRRVRALLAELGTDVVVGVGGYVATPAYLAAKRAKLPIVIHEANAVPGLANKLGAKLSTAERIGYTFAGTPLPGEQVGMPMRREIAELDRRDTAAVAAARTRLGLDPQRTTLVVTGGSLGAQRLNEAMVAAASELTATGAQVLHITGANKADEVAAATADNALYHVVDYVDGMESAYLSADLIVCRSGAGTVAEVTVAGLPAIYVPLPIGNGEQAKNAASVVAAGAAQLVDNADFTADFARSTVAGLLREPARLAQLAETVRAIDFPRRADRAMVDKIIRAVRPATRAGE